MNILITAGGTCEDIDSVRGISNHATGRLGSIISDTFVNAGWKATYICGETATPPKANAEILRVRDVNGLTATLSSVLHKEKFDCVVHSMAVSDYTPQLAITVDEMASNIMSALSAPNIQGHDTHEIIKRAVYGSRALIGNKISSKSDLVLLLKKTPKVISQIKAIQPNTMLVGFKLLSGAAEEELLKASQNLLEQNACTFVLANDLKNISNDIHKAILIDKAGILGRANTKQEIAGLIFKYVSERHGVS
ncbi:MAG: phosphopantothenate--cysteine ligase [Clostridiales bacterium]|jgi:phosphopantothenate-cysteine ligase|nr:phosphopantothenate--cysteine ligase [Clostridiales bacterium]